LPGLQQLFSRYGLTLFELLKFTLNWGVSILFANFLSSDQLIAQYEIISVWLAAFTFAPIWACLQYYSSNLRKGSNSRLLELSIGWLIFWGALSGLIIGLLNFYKFKSIELSLVLFFYSLFFVSSSLWEYYLFFEKKNYLIFYTSLLSLGATVLFFAYLYIAYENIITSYLFYTFYFFIKNLFLLYYTKYNIFLLSIKNIILSFQKLSYPFLKSLLGGLGVYANLSLVETLCSTVNFIAYRNGARELPVSLIIANSFSANANAFLSKTLSFSNAASGKALALFKKESRNALHIIFVANILFLLSSNLVFQYLFPHKLAQVSQIFDLYLLLAISRALFPQPIVNALGLWKHSFWVTCIECLFHVISSLLLTLTFGIIGAAIATLLAFLLEKILLIFLLYRQKVRFQAYTPLPLYFNYSLLLLLSYFIKYSYSS
jgi:O-antigen/teichoic acid export membrane protein